MFIFAGKTFLKTLEELIFNMSQRDNYLCDKIVLGFSILFMVLAAVPLGVFGLPGPCINRQGFWDWGTGSMCPALALALHNFISITVSVILLCIKIFVSPRKYVNFAMRVIWTVIQGIAVILLTLQAISPGLIYQKPTFDHSSLNGVIWIPGLIIVIPMFIYGIIESWNLNRGGAGECVHFECSCCSRHSMGVV